MSRIEQRQCLISALSEKLHHPLNQTNIEDVANDPEVQYNIRKTQNTPVHVPTFLQKNDGDSALKASDLVPVRGHPSVSLPPLSSPTIPLFICTPSPHLCTISRDYTQS
jgi:hypothetical protein